MEVCGNHVHRLQCFVEDHLKALDWTTTRRETFLLVPATASTSQAFSAGKNPPAQPDDVFVDQQAGHPGRSDWGYS